MHPDYAAVYSELSRRHWWWRARRKFVAQELKRLGTADGSLKLLEVGCADGANFPMLAAFGQVQGIESERAFWPAEPDPSQPIHQGPLDASYSAPHAFDRILLLDVLEHVDERPAFLANIAEALAPAGRVLLTVPAHPQAWTRHDELNQHRLRYTRRDLTRELEEAGLRVLRSRFFFHSLLVPKLLLGAAERWINRPGASIPRLPGSLLNRGAYALARAEQSLVTPWNLPFGSSLLAIADQPDS